jgi:hypothetical protein
MRLPRPSVSSSSDELYRRNDADRITYLSPTALFFLSMTQSRSYAFSGYGTARCELSVSQRTTPKDLPRGLKGADLDKIHPHPI